MRPDDGSRLLVVTAWGMVPRFITGRIVGEGRTVRVHVGVQKPAMLDQIVVRPNELQAGNDLYVIA